LGLALDEPKDTDAKYEQDGLTFLVDNNLLDTCGSIKVDFIDAGMRSGFSISSAKPIGGGGCSSASCGTDCG
jgi:iron-sulfur cluster assembly protein